MVLFYILISYHTVNRMKYYAKNKFHKVRLLYLGNAFSLKYLWLIKLTVIL